MPVWKNGALVEDGWRVAAEGEPVADGGPLIVPLARWRAERASLSTRNAPLGLLLGPGDDWSDVAADLSRFPLIAVAFPKPSDGRGFSIARWLRDRDNYAGEIRAVGKYIVDQMPLMRRVGIDSFAIESPFVLKALQEGVWPEVPFYLQPAERHQEVPEGTRPWARRPAPKH
jgi:phosphoadenosine phosphosulfate reductase